MRLLGWIRRWLSDHSRSQVPSRADFENTDDWFDALFLHGAEKAGLDLENLTDQQIEKLEDAYAKSISTVTEFISSRLIDEWKAQARRELRIETRYRVGFERNLLGIWRGAITKLEMFRSICMSIGSQFNDKYRQEAASAENFVFDTLARLHAHSCLIVGEIVTLLRHGYAHGAYSRWRTLHEIVVIAYFILEHGNETAKRFLLYDHIESYRAAKEYQEKFEQYRNFFEAGGHQPVEEELLNQLEETYEELCAQFGDSYGNLYGWAASALGTRQPTFKQIEEAAGLSNMRPFYRSASQHVHAEPKGILRTLGQPPSDVEKPTNRRVMMAGPSIYGLADPGQGAAITLLQITVALLSWKAGIGEIAYATALQTLCSEVVDEFIQTQDKIEAG